MGPVLLSHCVHLNQPCENGASGLAWAGPGHPSALKAPDFIDEESDCHPVPPPAPKGFEDKNITSPWEMSVPLEAGLILSWKSEKPPWRTLDARAGAFGVYPKGNSGLFGIFFFSFGIFKSSETMQPLLKADCIREARGQRVWAQRFPKARDGAGSFLELFVQPCAFLSNLKIGAYRKAYYYYSFQSFSKT